MSRRAKPASPFTRPVPRSSLLLLLLCGLAASATPAYAARRLPVYQALSGHTASVLCVAYFPDSRAAVTGSRDKTVRVWDVPTGRLVRTLESHTGYVFTVAVSPDGKRVASAGDDRAVRVWEVESGKLIALLEGHTSAVVGLKFLPDGQLVSAGHDSLRLWDVAREQLTWKSDQGVSEFDASADGKRVVVTRYSDGVHDVWDIPTRTMVRSVGGPGPMHPGLAISPDGTQVVGRDNSRAGFTTRWGAATGDILPSVGTDPGVEKLMFSPDGSLLLRGMASPAHGPCTVFDTKTWKPLRELEEPVNGREMTFAFAVSPDGKTLLATSGVPLPGQKVGAGIPSNEVLVYDLAHLRTVQTGPREGKLSWEKVPLKVRTLNGDTVDADAFTRPPGRSAVPWHRFPSGKGLDILLDDSSVFFQRTKDRIDQVLVDPDGHFKDLVWDGRHAWLNSERDSLIRVIDGDGKVVTTIGPAQGLPRSDCSLVLYPLSEGRVLAAGAALKKGGDAVQGSGWVGIIDLAPGAKPSGPPHVDVFYREPAPPDNWTHRKENAGRAFFPGWMTPGTLVPATGEGAKPHRYVWIVCQGTQFDQTPIMRVDPETRGVDLYNFGPPRPQNPGPHRSDSFSGVIHWRGDDEMIYHYGAVYRVKPGPTLIDASEKRLVLDIPYPNRETPNTPFLPIDHQLYVPGNRWARIDPRTLEAEDIGPGFRVDGELVTDDDVAYFDSAVLGPVAVVKETGEVFRLSVDPHHPLAVAATLDPPAGRPVPAEGAVDYRDQHTNFYCGDGALSFVDADLRPDRTVLFPYRNPRADLDARVVRVRLITKRLASPFYDNRRVELTEEERKRVMALHEPPVQIEAAKIEQLFTAWSGAPDDATRASAARELMARAKAIGERDTRSRREYVESFKAIFTPRQWKLLNYEVPSE